MPHVVIYVIIMFLTILSSFFVFSSIFRFYPSIYVFRYFLTKRYWQVFIQSVITLYINCIDFDRGSKFCYQEIIMLSRWHYNNISTDCSYKKSIKEKEERESFFMDMDGDKVRFLSQLNIQIRQEIYRNSWTSSLVKYKMFIWNFVIIL